MWARIIEFMLGLWLVLSPFIFRHDPEDRALWINDFMTGTIVAIIALLAIWPKAQYARLMQLIIATWLIGFGYFRGGYPAAGGYQNDIFIGLTLLLFGIIPHAANKPPESWRRHNERLAADREAAGCPS